MSAIDSSADPRSSGPPSLRGSGDDTNLLRQYASVLRRRWLWVVLGAVVGLLGGYASTLMVKEVRDPTTYFKATNTLVVSGNPSASSTPNLQQTAFLVRSADVGNEVATKLGVSVQDFNDRVTAMARSDVMAIDVTAISTDPAQAVSLADTTAASLAAHASDDQQKQLAATRDEVLRKLDDLKQQRTDLEDQIAKDPTKADLEKAQLDSVINQYRLTYEQFQTLAADAGANSSGLATMQAAAPIQINARAYNQRLDANRNARGSLTVATTAPASTFSETDLGTASPVSKSLRVAIGLAAGLVMGLLTAFLVEAWDDRLRHRDRVEAVTGLPVIAEVPKLPKDQRHPTDIPAIDSPRSRAAERFRAVRTGVLFALREHLPTVDLVGNGTSTAPVVMVTSPNPGEGKTTTVANLAGVFGDNGMRTLVIDCDYRKPSIAKYLAPVPALDQPDRPSVTRLNGVWFFPAPRGNASPADAVTKLRQTIAAWRDQFDMVLLDTPPMLTTNDATDLLAAADSVVLVLRAGQSRIGQAERVTNVLARLHADVLGVVFNGCNAAEMDPYYGSYYEEEGSRPRTSKGTNGFKVPGGPVTKVTPTSSR